jgi:hypothetical protein
MGQMAFYDKKLHECKGCRDGIMFNGAYTCGCYEYK